jgi:DNA topoisomerase-1
MNKTLVIVESAGKIKKIGDYLGSDYIIKASCGHVLDLDPKNLSVDVDNNYNPNYITMEGKHKIVNELKEIASKCNKIILASDYDREGEMICWSLAKILNIKEPIRIIFTEITKKALLNAIANPSTIDMNIVHSQQSRRILDRLLGYKLSPLLQSSINDKEAISVGRVQSIVTKIIIDKEKEITDSISSPYLKTILHLTFNKIKLEASPFFLLEKKELLYLDALNNPIEFLKKFNKNTIFKVITTQDTESFRKPPPPFITSSLQQDGYTKFKFDIKKIMDIAQKLYEGGFITYMRTDSPNISQDAINECKAYIIENYGNEYSKPINYKASINSQEAHECIRPTNIKLKDLNVLDKDQIKLYELIWKRFVASQMQPAKLNIQTIIIESINIILWKAINQTILFKGYLILTNDFEDDDNIKLNIKVNDILKFNKIIITEEFTHLPLRYNEANLVNYLEKNNIGRPSTYAPIINKVLERKYVETKNIDGEKKVTKNYELNKKYEIKEYKKEVTIGKEHKKIVPTELGIKITNFLENNFNDIMQLNFTSDMESYLDKIAENKAKWHNVVDIFYKKFNPNVEKLNQLIKINSIPQDKVLGINPKTNTEIFIGTGKYGLYLKHLVKDKYKYVSINDENISFEDALIEISYPIILGKIEKKNVELLKSKYGLYLKYNKYNYSIENQKENITLEKAREIINTKLLNYKKKNI